MGTPHQGGSGVLLGKLLANVASVFVAADDRLMKHLERDSEWLQQQLGQYGPISGDFVTKFAYEEYKTPTMLGHSIMVCPFVASLWCNNNQQRRLCHELQPSCPARLMQSRSPSMRTTLIWSSSRRRRTIATRLCQGICRSWLKVQVASFLRDGKRRVELMRVGSLMY